MSTSSKTSGDLKELVQTIEQMQTKAASNGHQFLAYLLDMARMEAVILLKQEKAHTS